MSRSGTSGKTQQNTYEYFGTFADIHDSYELS